MYSLPKNVYRERIDFSKIKTTIPIPNLIEIQKKSYERFLQMNRLPSEREDVGLQSVFKSVFPISDFRENSSLEFIEYSIGNWECKCGRLMGLEHLRKKCEGCGTVLVADPYGEGAVICPSCGRANEARGDVCDLCGTTVQMKLKYDVEECQERGMTFAVPLKVTIRLVVWNKDPETGVKTIRDIKEQEVYFGDIPLMGDHGTFIINGTERVIVSQLHRSPGAFFHTEDKNLYVAQIIPYRGSWVEFEYDAKNLLYVRIDRKRKFLASVFLRALGLRGAHEILRTFYTIDELLLKSGKVLWKVSDTLIGRRSGAEFPIPGSELALHPGKKIRRDQVEALKKSGVDGVELQDTEREGAFSAGDVDRPVDGRGDFGRQRGALRARHRDGAGEERRPHRDLLPREGRDRSGAVADAEEGSDSEARRGADRDLPAPASGRSADARQLAQPVREHVLQLAEVRLLARRPAEAQHQAEDEHAARREGAAPGGLLRGHPVPAEAAQEPGAHRRHRSPRQPPRPVGRRAAREPVPHRAGPDGAGDQGKDVRLPGNGDGHAARPDQREAGHGRDSRVLRVVAALAVHGPDEPAVGSHAQAAALGARAGRPVARARRLRGARRPPDALRAHLSD